MEKFPHFIQSWYTPTPDVPLDLDQRQTFSKVVWASDYWATIDENQCGIAKSFTRQLSSHFGVDYEEVSFEERWKSLTPEAAKGVSLPGYIVKVK